MAAQGRVFRAVLRNRTLLRVELAFVGFNAAEYGVWIAMLVYAYDHGGASTAGIVALAQLVPAALLAPIPAALADRHAGIRVLAGGYALQALAMGATAAALIGGAHPYVAYACAALANIAVTCTRPAQAVVVPGLARTPDELTAANVVSGWVESASVLAAPLGAGAILEFTGAGAVFALFAIVALGSFALVVGLPGVPPATTGVDATPASEATAGFRALRENRSARLLVLLVGAQYVMFGMADLLFVVLAIGVLHEGGSWAGYLNGAFGAGGVVGAAGAALLVGRRRLVPPFVSAALVWGAAWAVLGLYSSTAASIALLAVAGAGRSLFDVTGRTLLQRSTPTAVLARVFGILESLSMAGLAIGSLIVPLLVSLGGARAALLGGAAILPALIAIAYRRLREIDAHADVPVVELALLRTLPIFEALPGPALEGLARSLAPVSVGAGEVVIRQGDTGDRYYAIADGTFEVDIHGEIVNRLKRGVGFGEIALLRDVPRTATVRATTDGTLYALSKEPFLVALTGHGVAAATAEG